ncbi:DUF2244 domain-containing protein [Aquicoccus sp. SCR17]|nr:DUF2244 domain-containing protein [Carideicomes alvinocaridis]
MPYRWSAPSGAEHVETLTLWPHRSLPRRGFAAFVLGTFAMICVPIVAMLGTSLLWGLLPFGLAAVGALWWGLERSYRDGDLREELTLSPDRAHLVRTDPKGRRREWECNSYWTKVEMHPKGGPVPFYVTLKGAGREVEIGAFLSEEERKTLYGELVDAFAAMNPA